MSERFLTRLQDALHQLDAQGLRRRLRVTHTPCAPEVTVEGQAMVAFNSNDYLGLAAHPSVVAALQEGAALYGAGSGASHLISGHSIAHAELEHTLAATQAAHLPHVRALYFSTGYMANLAVLTALADVHRGDCHVFSESLNHASLIDGIRLARVPVTVYPHCDVAALTAQLAASTAALKVVVTDSVFSMDGDMAPLADLLQVCEQHDALLLVDDAHGFGVLGPHGEGVLAQLGLQSTHLIYMGTLGKAAGVAGAFVAAHTDVIEWMVQRARPYIYTTAAPPAVAHAVRASVALIRGPQGDARRAHLNALIHHFAQSPRLAHLHRLPSVTAVQPVILGSNAAVLAASAALQAQGLWVTAIRAPTVPAGTARLRVTLSAAHTLAQVDRLIAALADLEAFS